MADSVCAIILAAGHGSRYRALAGQDRNKLLMSCIGRDGVERTVLEHTVFNLRGVVDHCLLVTRPHAAPVPRLPGCDLLMLESAGMGDSIAAAVAARPDQRAWLIVLGDMPFILPDSLRKVVASITDDAISTPVYRGQRGHPVGFGRRFAPRLMKLSGDEGGRSLFKNALLHPVEVDDPGVLWDIDVPERLIFS